MEQVPKVATCRAERRDFRGWQAVRLHNGLIDIVAVPDIGGRILAFNMGSYAYLWMDERLSGKLFSPQENQGDGTLGTWKNYGGSKTWPAPQGRENDEQWHGPPDPILDSGRYALEHLGVVGQAATVRMRSPEDPRTGMQITRQMTLYPGGTHATLHLEMKNVSERARTWSIWDVVQLDTAKVDAAGAATHNDQAWLYVPTRRDSCFPRGYNVMFGPEDNPEWKVDVRPDLLGVQYQYRVGKIGIDSMAGWLAFVDQIQDYAFCQRFAYFAGQPYPDRGASVECWTTGLGQVILGMDYAKERLYHLEAEILGPLRRMEPGETQSFDVEWYAARCPGPIVNVTPAGCCHEWLRGTPVDGGTRMQGTFGVFHAGEAQLVWIDASGRELIAETIAPADPATVLRLDAVRRAPAGTSAVVLRVVEASGKVVGPLDCWASPV